MVRLDKDLGFRAQFQSDAIDPLQRLEAENYVKIVGAPDDARAKIVTLTAKGDKARLAALVRLGPQISQITAKVGAETFAALLPHLAKLRACLDAARG